MTKRKDDKMKLQGTMSVKNDELYIGGISCLELAKT